MSHRLSQHVQPVVEAALSHTWRMLQVTNVCHQRQQHLLPWWNNTFVFSWTTCSSRTYFVAATYLSVTMVTFILNWIFAFSEPLSYWGFFLLSPGSNRADSFLGLKRCSLLHTNNSISCTPVTGGVCACSASEFIVCTISGGHWCQGNVQGNRIGTFPFVPELAAVLFFGKTTQRIFNPFAIPGFSGHSSFEIYFGVFCSAAI